MNEYNGDITWPDMSKTASQMATDLIYSLNAGRTTLMNGNHSGQKDKCPDSNGIVQNETEIAELDACFAAFKELYDAANNVAVSQSDRLYSMRKFS